MFVHSSRIAPISGAIASNSRPASRMSRAAARMSICSLAPLISTRKNSLPPSVPTMGVSSGTPALSRWRGVRLDLLTVMMPTRLPGGSVACTQGNCIIALVATGTRTWAAISRWKTERKPQLVVIASAPWLTRSAAAARKSSSRPAAPCSTTFSGLAPRTTRYSTGNGQVVALPMSPGMRGNFASSIRMPSGAP